MALVVLVIGVLSIHYSELIPVRDGLGWDGDTFGKVALKWHDWVVGGHLNPYRVARLGPSYVISQTLEHLDHPAEITDVVFQWRVLNVACLVVAAYFWRGIATSLELSRSASWLGFVGIFAKLTKMQIGRAHV